MSTKDIHLRMQVGGIAISVVAEGVSYAPDAYHDLLVQTTKAMSGLLSESEQYGGPYNTAQVEEMDEEDLCTDPECGACQAIADSLGIEREVEEAEEQSEDDDG